jgi:DNA-binding transcriptional regulator YiaG
MKKQMYHYTDGGLQSVWLANGFILHKTKHGDAIAFEDVEGLTTAISLALTKKPSKLTGAEYRYLRQAMLISQASLGEMLGVSNQAVAIWEKTGRIPKLADTAIRLIFTAHANGDEKVKNIVTALNETERFMLVMRETPKGWRASRQSESPPKQRLVNHK